MTDALTLYTHPMSRGRIARWMLEEVGVPYEAVLLDYADTMKAPDYLAINPMGKVPAIRHGDRIVTETAAICAYLADAFPAAGLAPPVADRADYYRWLFFAAGPMEAAITNASLGADFAPDRSAMLGYGTLDAVLDTLEHTLTDCEHVAGGRFSAADLYLSAHLGWGMMFGSIPARPAFVRYQERHYARPAQIRASAIDDALIPPSEG